MSKRTLPNRSNRGQPPIYLRQLPSPPKKQRITQLTQQEVERRQLQYKHKSRQIDNLKKYPFGRAVHYFYDLTTFPRVEDETNALQNSFSNDITQLNGSTYGQILNRKMFGLPVNPRPGMPLGKQNGSKNVCYGYLYDLQDKKYQIDRVICTLKVLLKKLEKGEFRKELFNLDILKKDGELQKVLDETIPLCEKIDIIQDKINTLLYRKETNTDNWQNEDRLYFYHALNQQLHNRISALKLKLTQQQLVYTVYPFQETSSLSTNNQLKYYNTARNVLNVNSMFRSPVPATALNFIGSAKIWKLAGQLIAKRCQSLGETTYYEVKTFFKDLFGLQLNLRSSRIQSYSVYNKAFRKMCEQVKKSNFNDRKNESSPYLDKFLKKGNISIGNRIQITGKQYHFIIVFYWLCYGLQNISSLLEQFPNLLSLISSDFFPKVYSGIVEATNSAKVGMLCAAIQNFSEIFSKPDPLASLPLKLYFQFKDAYGVGIVFREDIKGCIDSELRAEEQKSIPSKRIKRDMI